MPKLQPFSWSAAGSRGVEGSCPAMMHACHRVVISDNTSLTPPRLEDGCHFRLSLSRVRARAHLRRTSLFRFRSRFCPKMAFVCLDCRTCHCHVRPPSLAGQWVWVGGGWNSGIRGSIGMGLQQQRRRTLGCRRTPPWRMAKRKGLASERPKITKMRGK